MGTETRNTYTAAELEKELPEAFDRALEEYREMAGRENCGWYGDICASGRETVRAAGLSLVGWSVDWRAPGRSYYEVSGFGRDERGRDIGEYTGRKARAWLKAAFRPKVEINFRKWESGNCPFTGVRFDDDCLDALKESIKNGETLREAFNNLGYVVAELCEGESESEREQTEACFLDHASANAWRYDKDGARI